MKKGHLTCTFKILKDLSKKQIIKTKNTFSKVAYSVSVVKMCWQKIKKCVWALMVHNL